MKSNKIVSQIGDYANQYDTSIKAPTFVVAGPQSAGKTTLFEAITKEPFGYSADNIATLCPVEYIMKKSKGEFASFNGKEVKISDIGKLIKEHMKKLDGKISYEKVVVKIEHPDSLDIILVDLPGFNFQDDKKDDIFRLVEQYMEFENTFIIAMVNAVISLESNSERNNIKEMLLDLEVPHPEEKMMFVINKLDTQQNTWNNNNDISNFYYLKGDKFTNHFITLNPGGKEIDILAYPEKKKFLDNIIKNEEKYLNKYVYGKINNKTKKIVGLEKLFTILNEKFSNFFKQNLKDITSVIRNDKENICTQIYHIKQLSNYDNEKKVRDYLMSTISSFIREVIGLKTSSSIVDSQYHDITSYDQPKIHTYDPARYGKTFFQDIKYGDSVKWDFLVPADTIYNVSLKKKNRDKQLFSSLHEALIGKSSFKRLKKMLEFLILSKKFANYDDTNIRIIAEGGRMGKFDGERAVVEMVKSQISATSDGIVWWSKIVESLTEEYCDRVLCYFRGNKQNIQEDTINDKVLMISKKYYMEYIRTQLGKINKRWKESIELYSDFLPIDLSVKTMMYILACPMEDVIVSESLFKMSKTKVEGSFFDEEEEDEQEEEEEDNTDNDLPEEVEDDNIQTSYEELFDDKDETKEKTNHENKDKSKQRKRQKKKHDNVDDEHYKNEESLKKIIALNEIRAIFRTKSKLFNVIDTVNGGYQTIYLPDGSYVNYNYLRSVAREYYVMVLNRFLFDFDASFNKYFYSKIDEKNMTDIQLFIEKSLSEEDIKEMVNSVFKDNENKQKELGELLKKQQDCENILEQVSRLDMTSEY